MGLIFALLLSPAHAGWFSRWCDQHLITDDPNQYEQASDDWVEREYKRLDIKIRWHRADSRDRVTYVILGRELRKREEIRRVLNLGQRQAAE